MNKRLLIFIFSVLCLTSTKADDFGIWTDFNASHNFSNSLSVDLGIGLRTNNNLKNVDRWSGSIGVEYDLCKYLKLSTGYTFLYTYSHPLAEDHFNDKGNWNGYNTEERIWRIKNRFSFSAKTGVDIGRFNISLRERYKLTRYNSVSSVRKNKYRFNYNKDSEQYDLRQGYPESEYKSKGSKTKNYLCSKLSIEYNIRHCKFTPDISIELSNNMSKGMATDKTRYGVGGKYKINKQNRIELHYIFNDGHDDDDDYDSNLHAIEIGYLIKF